MDPLTISLSFGVLMALSAIAAEAVLSFEHF